MASSTIKKIALIQSSTRAIRISPAVVAIVQDLLKATPSYALTEVTVIDLAEFKLPVFDEKIVPAMVPTYGQFEHDHSKKWSAAISPFDGYIFLSPEVYSPARVPSERMMLIPRSIISVFQVG